MSWKHTANIVKRQDKYMIIWVVKRYLLHSSVKETFDVMHLLHKYWSGHNFIPQLMNLNRGKTNIYEKGKYIKEQNSYFKNLPSPWGLHQQETLN